MDSIKMIVIFSFVVLLGGAVIAVIGIFLDDIVMSVLGLVIKAIGIVYLYMYNRYLQEQIKKIRNLMYPPKATE